jgi:crotonobetainyl-CoA:carnitine CoA-transferase CaiB-like acyl-CoA transferase
MSTSWRRWPGRNAAALARRKRGAAAGWVPMIDAAPPFSPTPRSPICLRPRLPRLGSRYPTSPSSPSRRTGWIVVGVGTDAMWRRLCAALAQALAATAPLRHQPLPGCATAGLDELLAGILAQRTVAHWRRAAPPSGAGSAVLGVAALAKAPPRIARRCGNRGHAVPLRRRARVAPAARRLSRRVRSRRR